MTGCFFTGGGALLEGGVLFFQATLTWGSIGGRGSIGGMGSIGVYTVCAQICAKIYEGRI